MAICPECQHRFHPWNVLRISRWTCIRCPACHVLLNRRIDLQGLALVLGYLSTVAVAGLLLSVWWFFGFILLVLPVVGWLADVYTVRLHVPTRRRRFLGYD